MVAGGDGSSGSEAYRFATIRTDKDDYLPGKTVYVSGSGWQPDEIVTFGLRELPAEHEARTGPTKPVRSTRRYCLSSSRIILA